MNTDRLLDYFVICGIKPDLFQDDQDSKHIRQSKRYTDLDFVNELELIVTDLSEALLSSDKGVDYLLLSRTTTQKLWLKVGYGRRGTFIRGGTPITDVILVNAEARGRAIVIPKECRYLPVRLHETSSDTHSSFETEGFTHFYGNYDLTDLLGVKSSQNTKAILVYSLATTPAEAQITDIRLQGTEEEETKGDRLITKVKDYTSLKIRVGPEKDSLLIFKKRIDVQQLSFKPQLIEHFPREIHRDLPLQAVQLFCFPDGLKLTKAPALMQVYSFILTTDKGQRTYCSTLVFSEVASLDFVKLMSLPLDSSIYWQKALTLVSRWSFFEQFETALREIYRRSLIDYGVPIERMICNLLQEVQLPEPGTAVQMELLDTRVTFLRSPTYHPTMDADFSIEILFRALPWPAVVAAYSAALIERKLILISSCKALRTHVAFALTSLMYPFKWEQSLIPVLPVSLEGSLQAPYPYLIGIAPIDHSAILPSDAVIIHLDKGGLEIADPLPKLPKKLSTLIASRFPKLLKNVPLNPVPNLDTIESRPELPSDLINSLKDIFLEFNTLLLKNYKHYLTASHSTESAFDFDGFRTFKHSSKESSFVYQVTDTTFFWMFLEENSESLAYFEAASSFQRTAAEPVFVKPFQSRVVRSSLTPNDVGFDICEEFRYSSFPTLKDSLFSEPRRVA